MCFRIFKLRACSGKIAMASSCVILMFTSFLKRAKFREYDTTLSLKGRLSSLDVVQC